MMTPKKKCGQAGVPERVRDQGSTHRECQCDAARARPLVDVCHPPNMPQRSAPNKSRAEVIRARFRRVLIGLNYDPPVLSFVPLFVAGEQD